jgi:hypothetical protein
MGFEATAECGGQTRCLGVWALPNRRLAIWRAAPSLAASATAVPAASGFQIRTGKQFFIERPHLCVGAGAVHHCDWQVSVTQLPISQCTARRRRPLWCRPAADTSAEPSEDSVLSRD